MNIWWKLFLIGWVFVIITRVILGVSNGDYYKDETNTLEKKSYFLQIVVHILMIISIIMVGGIFVGLFLGSWILNLNFQFIIVKIFLAIILGIIIGTLTYMFGYPFLGLYHIENKISQAIFIIVLIVSVIGWTIPISKYYKNVVTEEKTEIVKIEDYDLYYFCDISISNMKVEMEDSSVKEIVNTLKKILITDKVSYWYDNGKGEGLYNSVLAKDSKIIFAKDIEEPYIKIITYCDKTVKTDKNIGKEKIESQKQIIKYEFYLPESIKQYNIN